ncbi:MAG: reverse transcriptase-like protein [Methermicoccaceae archaeon]
MRSLLRGQPCRYYEAVEGIIGKDCWKCKWRKSDNWYASSGFCQWYPSYKERSALEGTRCGYYERGRGKGKRKRRKRKQKKEKDGATSRRNVTVYVSGLDSGKYGFVIYVDNEKVHEGCGSVREDEEKTRDIAEFVALIRALKYLKDDGYSEDKITVRASSQILVNIMACKWIVANGLYYPYYVNASRYARSFDITYERVLRIMNKEAENLAKNCRSTEC